ncbi:MAG: hypothetical protein ABI036_04560, partial [Fibrobacteria bacterium]
LVVKAAYIDAPDPDVGPHADAAKAGDVAPIRLGLGQRFALWGLGLMLVLLGICPAVAEWLARAAF